jgi:hypothetical protein
VEGARTRGDQGRGRRRKYRYVYSEFFFFLLFSSFLPFSLFSDFFVPFLSISFPFSLLSPLFFLLPVVVIARVKFSSLTISLSFHYTQRRLEAVLFDEFVM